MHGLNDTSVRKYFAQVPGGHTHFCQIAGRCSGPLKKDRYTSYESPIDYNPIGGTQIGK